MTDLIHLTSAIVGGTLLLGGLICIGAACAVRHRNEPADAAFEQCSIGMVLVGLLLIVEALV